MRGSVTWEEFLGKEQDAHKHGVCVCERESRREQGEEHRSHRYLHLLSEEGASTKRSEKMF